jgi:hypothetical protein
LVVVALTVAVVTMPGIAAENVGRIQQPLSGVQGSFWPTPSIPVCWDTWNDGDAQARGWVQDAVATTWERLSAVRFTGWANCAGFARAGNAVRLRVADVNPTASRLGTNLRGVAGGIVLNFTFAMWQTNCAAPVPPPGSKLSREFCIRAIAVHEFGHALGFTHEDWRNDRLPCNEPHVGQGTQGNYNITAYDLRSVMNYCNPNWIGDGRLSFHDRWGVVAIYGGWSPDFPITPDNAAAAAANAGVTELALTSRFVDELHMFYQGADGALATNWANRTIDNGIWHKPFPITLPGPASAQATQLPTPARAGTPIAAVNRKDTGHVLFIRGDGAVAETWSDGRPWSPALPITPSGAARADSPLVAVTRGDGEIHIFYIGPDGAVATTWSIRPQTWARPFPITPPGAALDTRYTVIGGRRVLWTRGSRLVAVVRQGVLHVFYQGGDGAIATTWSDRAPWAAPFPITPPGAGALGTAIDAVVRNRDQLHVFYQGPDRALATNWAVGPWARPFPITPPGAARQYTPLAALARGADKLDVNFIGPDDAVATAWVNRHVGDRWQPAFAVVPAGSAHPNSNLIAISRTEQTMDLFYLGRVGEIKTLWENNPRGQQ